MKLPIACSSFTILLSRLSYGESLLFISSTQRSTYSLRSLQSSLRAWSSCFSITEMFLLRTVTISLLICNSYESLNISFFRVSIFSILVLILSSLQYPLLLCSASSRCLANCSFIISISFFSSSVCRRAS